MRGKLQMSAWRKGMNLVLAFAVVMMLNGSLLGCAQLMSQGKSCDRKMRTAKKLRAGHDCCHKEQSEAPAKPRTCHDTPTPSQCLVSSNCCDMQRDRQAPTRETPVVVKHASHAVAIAKAEETIRPSTPREGDIPGDVRAYVKPVFELKSDLRI